MLKVCGVTFENTINYGSCLQAYALKTAIESLHVGKNDSCSYDLLKTRVIKLASDNLNYSGKRIGLVFKVCNRFLLFPIRRKFKGFERKHMRYADCECMTDLPITNDVYNAFVCGSDVIWNLKYSYGTGIFLLDFAQKYKFSYAASFGSSEIPETEIEIFKKYLPMLDAISVREKSAVEMVENKIGVPAKFVCDPCMLLTKKQWESLCEQKTNNQKRPYIFVYTTHANDVLDHVIQELQSETGLQVNKAVWSGKFEELIKAFFTHINTPQEWISMIRDAEYVVTNSFHATVFSIMFHKKFYTVVHGEKSKGINLRMYDLLNLFGLSNRMINSASEQIDTNEIDFSNVDHVIEQLRKDGFDYLQENLEAANMEKNNS